ncbi:MAG: putative PEP-binding protein, partial [Oscillospiraceae bacterium]
ALDEDGEDYSEEAVLFETAMQYKSIIMKKTGHPVPDEPFDQLREAVSAALGHWNSYATRSYRELHEIPESVGTAVVVQAMVFGNMDQNSCTGTVFTRDPNTGEKITCGEFLMKSQGGDTSFRDIEAVKIEKMEDFFPQLYRKFFDIAQLLERYNENVQEIEFTVESGKLYMLETKAARRTPAASVKIAVDMVSEGIVDRETSVANIRASDINKLVLKQFKDEDSIDTKTVDNFNTILEWADEFRTVGVRANIDTPEDAALAIKLGAEGVGLCRSEHMFFGEDRIYDFIRMIIAEDAAERNRAIAALKPYQKDDFKRIFRIMEDRPVTIRLLDPSFHRFLPHAESDIRNLAGKLKISEKKLGAKVLLLREENPAMGKRGSRLAVLHPEIVRMQTEAVIEAALEVREEVDGDLNISIMVPFISSVREFTNVRETVETTAMQCLKAADASLDFSVGTMIETPRAALLADMIAEKADFFSFGTNDLTELVYGLSKEDTEDLIEEYIKKDILDKNPFYSLDERGVGRMIEMACISGRKTKPKLKIGICGEHGGDPDTIEFCESIGINYFSCSTLRIPGARLAAAQAEINSAKKIERVR